MTTVASIIKSALRETNLIPLGVDPTTDQLNEGFALLSTIVSSAIGNEVGENLDPFPLGSEGIKAPTGYPWWQNSLPANTFVPFNVRIFCNLTGAGTVNLHPRPHDGARMAIIDVNQTFNIHPLTINGNGRNIEGQETMVYNTAGLIKEFLYRADLGNWVVTTPIVITGDMPFPSDFDDYFIVSLAMRLNPRYGQVLHPASVEAYTQARTQLRSRYSQTFTTVQSELGLQALTHYDRYWGYNNLGVGDPTAFFNSGYPN
jgi:hypothetical protein